MRGAFYDQRLFQRDEEDDEMLKMGLLFQEKTVLRLPTKSEPVYIPHPLPVSVSPRACVCPKWATLGPNWALIYADLGEDGTSPLDKGQAWI